MESLARAQGSGARRGPIPLFVFAISGLPAHFTKMSVLLTISWPEQKLRLCAFNLLKIKLLFENHQNEPRKARMKPSDCLSLLPRYHALRKYLIPFVLMTYDCGTALAVGESKHIGVLEFVTQEANVLKKIFLIGICGLILASLPTTAFATAKIRIDDLNTVGGPVECVDGDACDTNAFMGIVGTTLSDGDWVVNALTGFSEPFLTNDFQMDLLSGNTSTGGPPDPKIRIEFTNDPVTNPGGIVNFLSSIGGTLTSGGVLTFETFVGNEAFTTDTSLGSHTFTHPPIGFSTDFGGFANLTGISPLWLNIVVELEHPSSSGIEISSFNAHLNIPEPATIALLGLGLAAAGLVNRRKRIK